MDIAIKKVGQRDGSERFVLINHQTREVITVRDVSERALRRFCQKRGFADELVDASLARARERFESATPRKPVSETAETMEGDDLMFQLGLEEDGANA